MASSIAIKLEHFSFKRDEEIKSEPILELSGTPDGLMSVLLDFLGIAQKTHLTISSEELLFRFSSLGGITQIFAPVSSLTCAVTGIHKPLQWLILGVLLLLGGAGALFFLDDVETIFSILAIGLGGWLVFYYYITKFLILTFSTGDIGDTSGLLFKTTVINGREINMATLVEVIEYINHYMVERPSESA